MCCIPAVTGVPDADNEIVLPGAFTDSLRIRKPKVVWSHSWADPVGKSLEARELLPGDPGIPADIAALGGGCLWVKAQMNMGTQAGRDAFGDLVFFGDEASWSIGFSVRPGGASFDAKTGLTTLRALDLYEVSPVLWGAQSLARSLSAKVADIRGGYGDRPDFVGWWEILQELPSWPAVTGLTVA